MESFKLAEEAKRDLKDIHQYGVRQWGEAQADRYFDALIERLHTIALDPLRYPTADHVEAGFRKAVFQSHAIYFQFAGEQIEVMTIIRSQNIRRLSD